MVFLRISQKLCTFGLRISETIEEQVGTGNVTHPTFLKVQVTPTLTIQIQKILVLYKNQESDSIRVEGCNKAH
jgi:hypothetical protein